MDTKQSRCTGEKVLLYAEGKLKGKERIEVEEHLKRCDNCRQYADFVSSLRQVMQGLPETEKESCPSSLVLGLLTSGQLDPETEAHVTAHILHCDDCFDDVLTLERMGEALVKKAEEPSLAESMAKLVVRVVQGILEVVEASGQVFQGRELQPALVRLRGPQKELYRDYVMMIQKIGEEMSIEIKVSGSEKTKGSLVSVSAYRTIRGEHKRGVSGLVIKLTPKDGRPSISGVTSTEGAMQLGHWTDGNFVIEISDEKNLTAQVTLELYSEAERKPDKRLRQMFPSSEA